MQLSLLAGNVDGPGNLDGIPGAFSAPAAVVSDGAGRVFVADGNNHTIRQINMATGVVSTLAGTPSIAGSSNGTGSAARFYYPYGISYSAPDATYIQGRLFVADSANHVIRQIDVATQAVSTLAGTAGSSGNANGTGSVARFSSPRGISYSAPDTTYTQGRLFVADSANQTIRQINVATQVVTTLAGTTGSSGSTDGTGNAASFSSPWGISYSAPDGSYAQGRLFVADTFNNTIRQIDLATQAVTTLAGTAGSMGSADGTGIAARFDAPRGISYSAPDGSYPQGRLFVVDANNRTIRQIDVATKVVSTLAGTAGSSGSTNGTGSAARFSNPLGIGYSAPDATYTQGRLFVADSFNHTIRQIDVATQAVSTLAGTAGISGSADAVGSAAGFNTPWGMSYSAPDGIYPQGRLFVVDYGNLTIRQINMATGGVSALAGTAGSVGSADGTGSAARFYYPKGVVYSAPDGIYPQGRLFVADTFNDIIRQMDVATQAVSTLAGTAGSSGAANGTGSMARFDNPYGITYSAPDGIYPQGRLFVADSTNHTIRQIDVATQAVTTLAGTAGSVGSADGTGSAARFYYPQGIVYSAPDATYPQGRLFIADNANRTIRQIDVASQAVSTLAGTAGSSGSADGVGSAARFNNLHHISYSAPDAIYPQGRLFVADATNHNIRQIDIATQAVTTAVGQAGKQGFVSGALPGVLNTPVGVQATPNGLFITMRNGMVQVAPLP